MNSEMLRAVGVRVLIVAIGACLGWYLVVKPRSDKLSSLEAARVAQGGMIEAYHGFKGDADSDEDSHTQNTLELARGLIVEAVVEGDPGTMLHTLLNERASEEGVRISSIESVQSREIRSKIGETKLEVTGNRALLRVEFEGVYSDVVGFMDGIAHVPYPVRFAGFRVVPIGVDSVRVSAEVEIVTLGDVPGVSSAFAGVETEMGS